MIVEKNKEQRQRNRNITWFNPPYSKNAKTNIVKIFFKLHMYYISTSQSLTSCKNIYQKYDEDKLQLHEHLKFYNIIT